MWGDTAIELLRELKRAAPHLIPAFNDDKVRQIIDEINSLYADVKRTMDDFGVRSREPEVAGCLFAEHAAILRNKRCLLAYLADRVERLKRLRWEVGLGVLPEFVREKLSQPEIQYYEEYSKLLVEYQAGALPNFDTNLSGDSEPPKRLFAEVRCLEDMGEVLLPSGVTVTLARNSQHFLRRSDVEQYIRQGRMEHIA
eukprot:m.45550 g.45550  ORF g.45550 m.45550 type:complete len:198 (-) comp6249_c0_seq2:552-1145(-)